MMRKLFTLVSFVAAAALIAVACGKEDKKEEPTAIDAAGSLSLDEPSKMFLKAGDALASAKMSDQTSTSLLAESAKSVNDPLCSNNGEPWDQDANSKLAESNEYAPRHFYCLVNSKVKESVETLPGFFKQQSSIVCTMEENLNIKGDEFTDAGKEYVPEASKVLKFSDTCWPQGKPDNQDDITVTSVVGKKLAESTGWTYELAIVATGFDFKMRYFNKDGVFGFSRFQTGSGSGKGEGMTAVVDANKGVILYDAFNDKGSSHRRVTRLRVKGTFDNELKFSEITEGRGFSSVSGPGFSAETGTEHVFSMYTVHGTKATGYKFKTFKNTDGAKSTMTESFSICKDGNCSGAYDIDTKAAMTNLQFRDAATTTAWDGFMSRKPMCEKDTDLAAAISYSALFPNTGAFGKCE